MTPGGRTATGHETTTENALTTVVESLPRHAHWIPRVLLAAIFIDLGFLHLTTLEMFAGMFGMNTFTAFLVGSGEVTIGVFLLLGGFRNVYADLATRAAGALTVLIMIGAIAKAHWPYWSFVPTDEFPMGGMEFQVVLIAVGLVFLLRGSSHVRT